MKLRFRTALVLVFVCAPLAAMQTVIGGVGAPTASLGVAAIGDVTGDAVQDFLVARPDLGGIGSLALYSGADRTVLHELVGSSDTDHFAGAIAAMGDIDGDGVPDFAVAIPHQLFVFPASVRIHSGTDASLIREHFGTNMDGFGAAIAGVGDVDGDGWNEIAIARPFANTVPADAGIIDVYRGVNGSLLLSLFGSVAGGRLGGRLAAAGDVDGDGVPDLVAGSHQVAATSAQHAVVFSLSTGLPLHTVTAAHVADFTGSAVAGLGDLDRDGHADYAVGSPGYDSAGVDRGLVRIYSGQTGTLLLSLLGDGPSAGTALAVAAAGDVDGDGWQDVVVGWRLVGSGGHGAARVLSGRDLSQVIVEWETTSGTLSVAPFGDIDGDGFDEVLVGEVGAATLVCSRQASTSTLVELHGTENQKFMGRSLRSGADYDGDGRPDLLLSVQMEVPYEAQIVRVVSGATGATIQRFEHAVDYSHFGRYMDVLGDVDGDGIPEVLIGDPTDGTMGNTAGAVFLYSGGSGALIATLYGWSNSEFGTSVRRAGDVDADGYEDFILGIPDSSEFSPQAGAAKVYSGLTRAPILTLSGEDVGLPSTYVSFGQSCCGAGDVNADGRPDLLVGDPTYPGPWPNYRGRARVLSGVDGSVLLDVIGEPGDRLGEMVSPLGDANNDGHDDFLVATVSVPASFLDPLGPWRIEARSGADGGLLYTIHSEQALIFPYPEMRLAVGGDFNDDAFPDVLVGDPKDDSAGADAGRVRIYSGKTGAWLRDVFGPLAAGALEFGSVVCATADVDGDGYDDLAVGSPIDALNGPQTGSVRVISLRPPSWTGLGHALGGTWGTPSLWVEGECFAGEQLSLSLGGSLSGETAALVIGLTSATAPFKGGLLVPAPTLVLPLVLDGLGSTALATTWPAGLPAGFTIWLQAWISDPAGPAGFAATNAIRGTVP
ncbi:MAG: FG-GAP-like repeat-containing protein [Planctomycetota bacterium]